MQAKALILVPLLATAVTLTAVTSAAQIAPANIATPLTPSSLLPNTYSAPAVPVRQAAPYAYSSPVASALSQWYQLRQTDSLPFSSYASFLSRYRGWPGETNLRKTAERAIDPLRTPPANVVGYFRIMPPLTPLGHARNATALLATGQVEEARLAARAAWHAGAMPRSDEDRIIGTFGGALSPADHDQRMEALLAAGDTASAQRTLAYTSAVMRPYFDTRLALQRNAPDAAAKLGTLGYAASGNAGVLMDRANWLRSGMQSLAARSLLAQPHNLTVRPANPEKWYETMLTIARGAAADNQWTLAYQIASQVDDAYPAGTDVSLRPTGERDDYTSLVWLAGTTALQRLNRPADAVSMFLRYARGGRSAQVLTKGYYWAGRAAQAAGRIAEANTYFAQAAVHSELFYGQLSLERLGRPVTPPPAVANIAVPTEAERVAFYRRDAVAAARLLGQQGRWDDQSLFIRSLSEQATTPTDRVLSIELAHQIGRPDLAVWLARNARNAGAPFYVRPAYPQVRIPAPQSHLWSLAHGIIRQESSFDRAAVSHAGARGMMQLMTPTARQVAGKMSVPYEVTRLTRDPDYNIMLGSSYFAQLMDQWGGYAPLAIASYNAGPGNVRKWIAANGDPRTPGSDIVRWIEDIPFLETRGYVQRVLENAVVYDTINPSTRTTFTLRLSYYLGKSSRPG